MLDFYNILCMKENGYMYPTISTKCSWHGTNVGMSCPNTKCLYLLTTHANFQKILYLPLKKVIMYVQIGKE